ncbi:MAG: cation:proton antiporter [Polyangiaceae bacterium]|nr:cation:proton antiporter [Polyangiaceae bacterium]
MHGNMLAQAFIYLLAAVVMVPIAKRLGLGSVLGYLLAGVALGPFALGLIGEEGADVMHFAEFGVVMMLFLVGLELRPELLWRLRRPILGLGGLQVAGTTVVFAGAALALGLGARPALAIGLIFAGSSTAIALQSLTEKGLLKSEGGQAAFSVLLFQDIAVIPTLAVFPLLAAPGAPGAEAASGRPGWQQALMVLGAVVAIIAGGRFLVRPLFRFLAETRLREIFTAAALALVIGIALLMGAAGLSPALGTFLAGVVLAESEYRHELESDIEPFKGLLLGVFFIAVGASIDFRLIASRPLSILGLVVGLMAVKLAILLWIGSAMRLERRARAVLAMSLAQGGEFAFVLVSFALQTRVLTVATAGPVVAIVAVSMLLTPLVFMALDRVVLPRMSAGLKKEARAHDEPEAHEGGVIIAGFGRFGQVVGRFLRASGIPTTVLDLDPAMVDLLRRLGLSVHYGDASRLDLLHAAGCERARLFVLAVDEPEKANEIATTVRKHFPHLPIMARARSRQHYYQLTKIGAELIIRETFGSALELGEAALRKLGYRAHQAHRMAVEFRRHDEASIKHLATLLGQDQTVMFAAARQALAEQENLLREEAAHPFHADVAWDTDSLRADSAGSAKQESEELRT